jgi:hypothetical protein
VKVNGNLQANQIKKRPYFIVLIKDLEIDGIFTKRTTTFVSFAGSKVERGK